MQRFGGPSGTIRGLGKLCHGAFMLALMLGGSGCAWFDQTTAALDNGLASTGARLGAPWGAAAGADPGPDLTVQRVRVGQDQVPLTPLTVEPGDVWPLREAPRTTLINPDATLRGGPEFQPDLGRPGDPTPPAGPTNRLRGSAGVPQPSLPPLQLSPGTPPLRSQQPPAPLPPSVIDTPRGPLVPYGGTGTAPGGYQTFTPPGGGVGVITRDGGVTTIRRPDGTQDVVPTPR